MFIFKIFLLFLSIALLVYLLINIFWAERF